MYIKAERESKKNCQHLLPPILPTDYEGGREKILIDSPLSKD